MIELRWVEFGPNKQLEYRTKIYSGRRLDATGKTPDVWSDWVVINGCSKRRDVSVNRRTGCRCQTRRLRP